MRIGEKFVYKHYAYEIIDILEGNYDGIPQTMVFYIKDCGENGRKLKAKTLVDFKKKFKIFKTKEN